MHFFLNFLHLSFLRFYSFMHNANKYYFLLYTVSMYVVNNET